MFEKFITLISGARRGGITRTFASFTALFLLLTSYYMVKPLRNSQFLKEFNADWLPFFFLFTAILSIIVTKVFNSFYKKVDNFRLVVYTYLIVMACKLLFHFYLPIGGKTAIVFFYLWASVYFLLSIAVLWGCINLIFKSEEGERCYGFIAIGGMVGGITGSQVSALFSQGALKDYALLISAAVMGTVLFFIHLAMKGYTKAPPQRKDTEPLPSLKEEKPGFFSDFKDLWGNRYVRSIAVMMYSIAAFNTVLEFQSQKVIDQRMAEQIYASNFQDLNQALNQRESENILRLNPVGLQFVFGLKNSAENSRLETIQNFLKTQGLNLKAPDLLLSYKQYQDQKETKTRELFSNIFFFQNILGVSLLFFVSRFLFKYMGVRFTIMIMPTFYTVVIISLFFPLNLFIIESFLVVGYGLNYSLNRATKELLYTKTSDSTIFRLKPLIDGPIRRLGDVTMALFKLALTVFFVQMLAWKDVEADQIFFITSLAILGFWIYSVWYVGGRYDAIKQQEENI